MANNGGSGQREQSPGTARAVTFGKRLSDSVVLASASISFQNPVGMSTEVDATEDAATSTEVDATGYGAAILLSSSSA